jgi:Shikimate 5-dehydrogenase
LHDKNILIIGSGSVIYSVLSSLAVENPARIDLLMRDTSKLVEFQVKSSLIKAYSQDIAYDLVINTTPNNPVNELFANIQQLAVNALAYDMSYTAKQTLFMGAMEKLNSQVIQANGIGMLIQQAKVGFQLVFGVMPEVENVYTLLQGKLNG